MAIMSEVVHSRPAAGPAVWAMPPKADQIPHRSELTLWVITRLSRQRSHASFRQLRTWSGCCRHVRSGGAAASGSELLEMVENIRPSLHEPHALLPTASPSWKHVRQTPNAAPLAHINRDY
jgi:hypothetical protein